MPLPFRQRIFVILVALTAVPTALAVVGWALAVRTVAPSAGARVALEEMTASARLMVDRMDTTHLSARERAAFREHLEQLSNSVTLARRAETYLRYYAGGFAAVVFVLGAFAVIAAVRVAGHLSRQLSRPIDELVGWTRLIRRRMPLSAGARDGARRRARAGARGGAPAGVPRGGAPRRARDQESAHRHADRGRPVAAVGRSGGTADGRGSGSHWRPDRAGGPARGGVLRVRAPPRGAEERGGPRGPPDGPREERRAVGGGRLGASQRGAVQTARALRSAAAGVRESAAQRRGGGGRARGDRGRGEPGRGRPGGHDRRSWGRDPGRPAAARVRAVLHDQARRDRSGTRPRAADDRGP